MVTVNEVITDVRSKVGQRIDMDGAWGGQCMDLVEYVAAKFGKRLGGNAIDGLNRAKAVGWQVIYDAPGINPKAGDIFVMNVPGHNFGHIGLVTADSDGRTIKTLEQNVDGYSDNNKDGINDQLQVGGVVREMSRDFTGIIGWFRPPYSNVGTTSTDPVQNHGNTYRVRISINNLNVRKEPSLNAKVLQRAPVGVYTIVDEKDADGLKWGRMKAGGWIALKYTKKV